jgi:hypothetical protein
MGPVIGLATRMLLGLAASKALGAVAKGVTGSVLKNNATKIAGGGAGLPTAAEGVLKGIHGLGGFVNDTANTAFDFAGRAIQGVAPAIGAGVEGIARGLSQSMNVGTSPKQYQQFGPTSASAAGTMLSGLGRAGNGAVTGAGMAVGTTISDWANYQKMKSLEEGIVPRSQNLMNIIKGSKLSKSDMDGFIQLLRHYDRLIGRAQ